MLEVINKGLSLLEDQESFVLATILHQAGSTPRHAGSRMIIKADGSIVGSVGGGTLEAAVMKRAQQVMESGKAALEHYLLDGKTSAELGMICGGNTEILVEYVSKDDPAALFFYRELLSTLQSGKKAGLVTRISLETSGFPSVEHSLIKWDGGVVGKLPCPEETIRDFIAKTAQCNIYTLNEKERIFVETIESLGMAVICGAGHLGQKLQPLLKLVGFKTVVLDDREEFANRLLFPTASLVSALSSYDNVFAGLEIDEDSFIVIVTRGHLHDKTVLRQSLRTRAGYIGMVGSRSKRLEIYNSLEKEGFGSEDFARVYSPIGLKIGAETPEEIAVSIAAEMIQVRASKKDAKK